MQCLHRQSPLTVLTGCVWYSGSIPQFGTNIICIAWQCTKLYRCFNVSQLLTIQTPSVVFVLSYPPRLTNLPLSADILKLHLDLMLTGQEWNVCSFRYHRLNVSPLYWTAEFSETNWWVGQVARILFPLASSNFCRQLSSSVLVFIWFSMF